MVLSKFKPLSVHLFLEIQKSLQNICVKVCNEVKKYKRAKNFAKVCKIKGFKFGY